MMLWIKIRVVFCEEPAFLNMDSEWMQMQWELQDRWHGAPHIHAWTFLHFFDFDTRTHERGTHTYPSQLPAVVDQTVWGQPEWVRRPLPSQLVGQWSKRWHWQQVAASPLGWADTGTYGLTPSLALTDRQGRTPSSLHCQYFRHSLCLGVLQMCFLMPAHWGTFTVVGLGGLNNQHSCDTPCP